MVEKICNFESNFNSKKADAIPPELYNVNVELLFIFNVKLFYYYVRIIVVILLVYPLTLFTITV